MKEFAVVWAVFATIVLIVFVNCLSSRISTMEAEAVKRGYAEWVVDAYGNTEWRWK